MVFTDKRTFNSVIAKRLIVYVVLFSSAITLIITALQLYADYSNDVDLIQGNLTQIEHTHVETLASSLWTADRESMQTQLDGILRLPDMEFLEIREGDKIWATAGSQKSKSIINKTYPLIFTSKNQPRKLGNLYVAATLDSVYQRLINSAITILLSNAIKTFLVASFIVFIFHQMVTRHLSDIANFTKKHDIDNQDYKALKLERSDDKKHHHDELDILVQALNQMRSNIHASFNTIKESENKYRQLVELAQEGIWQIDKNTITTFVNPSMANMLGYSPDEMIGKRMFNFMSKHSQELARTYLKRIEKGFQEQYDFEFIRKDGQHLFVTMKSAPVLDNGNNYIGAIAGVMDITERKQTEKELAKHRANLEDLIEERTLELKNAQNELLIKERLATLGQLTATVSHELRNPLGSIRPSLFVLKKTIDPENKQAMQAINRIDRSVDRCDNIIDELLDFTRTKELNYEKHCIDKWVAQVVEEQSFPDDLQVECEYTLADTTLWIDPGKFRRALINIIENGYHAMMDESNGNKIKPGSTLKLSTKSETDRILITVSDTGSGISENLLSKIFEPLFSTKGFGVGLGLSIVKQIMEHHGGGIHIESQNKKGTTSTLWLPKSLENAPIKSKL